MSPVKARFGLESGPKMWHKLQNLALVKVLKGTARCMKEAQASQTASALAYTTILSFIPLLAVSFSFFKAFGGLEKIYSTIEPIIIENLAEGSDQVVITSIQKFIGNAHAGAIGAGGIVGLIITSVALLTSAERGILSVWHEKLTRPLFHRIASYWLFITLGPFGFSVAIGFASSTEIPISQYLPSGTFFFVLSVMFFSVIYKSVPKRIVNWKAAILSGLFTSLLWDCARLLYSLYVQKVVHYDKIYGSLGALPILLVWIWVLWLIVLTGAALTASIQDHFEGKLT